jgi:hypothetical protein
LLLFAALGGDRTLLLRWLAVHIHSYRRKYCSSHWTRHISDNIQRAFRTLLQIMKLAFLSKKKAWKFKDYTSSINRQNC